jgi:hypothetical protein
MRAGIGHNSGEDLRGYTGRLHRWRRARRALLGEALPVEVVRTRVRRAAALGLDYGTYAGVRASTGRDIVALLFSSNALGLLREAELDGVRAGKLAAAAAQRGALVHPPLDPGAVAALPQIDWAGPAPRFTDRWSEVRRGLKALLRERGLPGDAVLMVGAAPWEAEWPAAADAAGYLAADRYFGETPPGPGARP